MLIIATLNRWLIKYSSSLALAAKKCKWIVASSWRMDETYLKVKGQWVYLYRAVDIFGDTVGFMLSEHRDEAGATGFPSKVVIQNSKAVPLESGLACNQSTGQDRTFS